MMSVAHSGVLQGSLCPLSSSSRDNLQIRLPCWILQNAHSCQLSLLSLENRLVTGEVPTSEHPFSPFPGPRSNRRMIDSRARFCLAGGR